jgi:uncharacterized membrane protein (TIGR02234 family)
MTDEQQGQEARSHFVPVLALGLGSAALGAVASAKPWLGGGAGTSSASDATQTAIDEGAKYPLAAATSLVLLAVWGVLLVTRGVVRRTFAVLAAVAALALVATVVAGRSTLRPDDADSLATALGRSTADVGWTGWFWVAAVASVLAVVAGALAVRLVGRWPEMGSRYDAPTTPATNPAPAEEIESERDLWRALDEGRDPTRDP